MEARETAQNLFRTSGEPARGGVARAAGRVDSNLTPVSVANTNRSSNLGSESVSVACLLGATQLERLLDLLTGHFLRKPDCSSREEQSGGLKYVAAFSPPCFQSAFRGPEQPHRSLEYQSNTSVCGLWCRLCRLVCI